MKLFTATIIALEATALASGQTVIMDQIGPDDGSNIGGNITACQDFEAAYDIYDVVTADNFSTDAGGTITQVEMVLNGWNGFTDPSTVSGYTANLYVDENSISSSLTGDIASEYIDAADATQSTSWAGDGFLMSVSTTMISVTGTQLVGLVPSNDFATGGQTGTADSLSGDGSAWQGNPGGGFGMPDNWQLTAADAAYRLQSDTVNDPCNSPLPTECTTDVDGDGIVGVSDVLAVIGSWGDCGDGTYRPAGDVAPLPNGDCCVDVADILAVVGSWGEDCTPRGACCSEDGTVCTDNATQADCEANGGNYEGDDSMCSDIVCAGPYGDCPDGSDTDCDDCWEDGDDATTDCNAGLNGDGSMDLLTLGVPLCGETSVYQDVSGSTYRDTDWFECAALSAGGNFSIECETETATALFGIVDLDAGAFVEYATVDPGAVVNYDFAPLAPGNYCFWVGPNDWNTDWNCANGPNYWMQLNSDGSATGACCVDEDCVGEISMNDCTSQNGIWHFDKTCADVNDCLPEYGACCFTDNSCLDNQTSDDCAAFGGLFAGVGTQCSDDVCGSVEYDQIGMDDGSAIGTNITASQIFEAANEAYNIATLDNFTFDASTHIIGIEAVINGWNGFVNIAPVTNYTISVYSSTAAAGADLVGDVYSIDIVTPNLPTWSGSGELVQFDIDVTVPAGEYFFAIIPWNDFSVNGQTGISDYVGGLAGDGVYWQANPNGGFGFGAVQEGQGDSAYRLTID